MEIRELEVRDTEQFCELIVNMYSDLGNLEWFTPMPYDYESVKGMIESDRFYIAGLFVEGKLVGVGSLDYKCGKLIGKIDFPSDFDTTKMVEAGFGMVHSDYKGNKMLQVLEEFVLLKARLQGIKYIFAKVHKDNIASKKSVLNKGFEMFADYSKEVKREDFENLANTPFFSPSAKPKAIETLTKFEGNIIVEYNILTKKL